MVDLLAAYRLAKGVDKTVELKLLRGEHGEYTCSVRIKNRTRECNPQEAARRLCAAAGARPLENAKKHFPPAVDFLDVLLLERYKEAGIMRLSSA